LLSSQTAVLFVVVQPIAGSQLSSVHGFSSSQTAAVPPMHAPAVQVSPSLHASPSSQAIASLIGIDVQPATGSQTAALHSSSNSEQSVGSFATQSPRALPAQ
jgi:hypothetical protein